MLHQVIALHLETFLSAGAEARDGMGRNPGPAICFDGHWQRVA